MINLQDLRRCLIKKMTEKVLRSVPKCMLLNFRKATSEQNIKVHLFVQPIKDESSARKYRMQLFALVKSLRKIKYLLYRTKFLENVSIFKRTCHNGAV